MTMYDYTPVRHNDKAGTYTASAAINASQLVTISGVNTVAPSTAGDRSIGVAAMSVAAGQPVTVYPLPGWVHECLVKATSVIAAGAPIIAGAGGTIDTGALGTTAAAGTLLGLALTSGTGDGSTVRVRWIGL